VSDLDDVLIQAPDVDGITVFTPRLPPEGAAVEDRGDGYLVVRYPAFELIPNFPIPKLWRPEFWRALRAVDLRGNDVFVSHTRFFLTSALALLCARLARRPLLHVEHGAGFVELDGWAPRAAARIYDLLIGRVLLRRADAVVAVSHAAADFVRRLSGRDEVTVIHRGIWMQRLDVLAPDEQVLEWARGRPVVTFVGRLIDGKGVPDLLRAFAAVEGTQAVACIVGDGPRREELELLAGHLGISERVLFLGYLPEERAWAAIRASDIVVNPSYTEGLGTSVLEAALMSKPVLATAVGGHGEVIADGVGGFLVPAKDVEALRLRLEQLLADPALRQRMGAAARAEAAGRFDWELSAARFVEIFRVLLAASPTQPIAAARDSKTSSNTDS
jgi:glycosyltransferase involved in cell wall biosynthesis